MKRGQKSLVFLGIGFLFFLNLLGWQIVFRYLRYPCLEVTFFDVGQGDAIFIETPQGHQILIDGGPDSKILEKLAVVLPFWDRKIDMIILTHPEKDHLAGLIEVLKKYDADYILSTGIKQDTSHYGQWQDLIKKKESKVILIREKRKVRFSSDIWLDILWPLEDFSGKTVKNSNNSSIVARLDFRDNSFLFTGDIPEGVEKDLIAQKNQYSTPPRFADLDSDVLKVAHHGSKYSTSEEFLEEVSPQFAVILSGKNPYGHPHPELLARLIKFDIRVLRTDEEGDIKIFSEGENLKILKNL